MSSLATCVRRAVTSPAAAALLAALPLLAGEARAAQVTINLNGKVLTYVHLGNPNAEIQLQAKGVQIGTPATLKLVLEDSTPGVPVEVTPTYTYQQYDMAIVDIVIKAGTWEAHFAPPSGMEATNFVQVADNADYLGQFDLWNGTALGVDTDNILSQGSSPVPWSTFFLHFLNQPPIPATTDALVQDLTKYKAENNTFCQFHGVGGSITIDFTPAPPGVGASLARSLQLKAAGKLGNSVFKGLGKLTALGPDKDPQGTAKDELLQKSSDTFQIQFVAAINKALKKGGSAPLGESSKQDATDYLMDGLNTQTNAITADEDSTDATDRAIRGTILKALAAECRSDFNAHAKDVKKPDINKLNFKLEKSREKFVGKVNALLDKAFKKGYVFFGPSPEAIANDLKPYIDAFVDLTGTGL
jgi:hypothetical protein